MKRTASFFLIFAMILFAIGGLHAQSSEDAKLQKAVDDYLDQMWKFYPSAATLAGYHKYDDRLEDLSGSAIEKRHNALDAFNQQLVAKIDRSKLSADNQIIHGMIVDALDLEFVRFENMLPWEYNPLFYNDIIINSIYGLLTKDFAPLDTRVKNATERAQQIPGLIKRAKDSLKTPARLYTEAAIRQIPGIISFYKNDVPGLIAKATVKNGFQAEIGKVVSSLEDFQRYLQYDLLPKSTGNFRLGAETHLRTLRMMAQGNIPMEELVARATADVKNIRREMFLVCIPFYRIMYPNINLEQMTTQRGEEEVKNIVIKGVLDKIKTEHASKADFLNRVSASVEGIKAFIAQSKLFNLPDAALTVEALPPAFRGATCGRLVSPGVYDATGGSVFQIQSIPDDWSAEQAASFLEENNNFYLDFMIIQKIFPGTFLPGFFTRKAPSLIKKVFPNQGLLKGWPIFSEDLLINAGFGNYDLRMRLNQLKLLLKNAMDFQLELNIHQGGMTQEQAVKYMVGSGFQTEAEANEKWNKIILHPCDAALSYVGYQEILDLAKEYKKLKGDSFNESLFLQKLLSFGAIPLRDLKAKLAS